MEAAAVQLGHNQPPSLVEDLQQRLADRGDINKLVARRDELLGSAERAPKIINDDDTAGKVGDLIKLITACMKTAEAARVAEKEPYLEAGRAVDGWFKKITDPLDAAKRKVQSVYTDYLQRKEAEARRRAEDEARKAREESERLAREAAEREAAHKPVEPTLDAAVAAETRAIEAEKIAEAKPAELSRTRGDLGSVASLRREWTFDENSLDRAALDVGSLRPYLPLDALHKAIRAYIKAGGRELRGVRIFEQTTSVVR